MKSAAQEFRVVYAARLRTHLSQASENTLRSAYELGREAVVHELSVLDLAAVHNETILAAVRGAADRREIVHVTDAAGEFFLESLSAFEMVRRGFREARAAAIAERRHSAMLRQLSTLLADASLAVGESDSFAEALRLVAEEARELTDARWSVLTAAFDARAEQSEIAVDSREGDVSALAHSGELAPMNELVHAAHGAVRLTGRQLASEPAFRVLRESEVGYSPGGWMAAPLTSLNGRDFGYLHVFDKQEGEFTDADEAVLVHLGEMASSALERAHLYRHQAGRRTR